MPTLKLSPKEQQLALVRAAKRLEQERRDVRPDCQPEVSNRPQPPGPVGQPGVGRK